MFRILIVLALASGACSKKEKSAPGDTSCAAVGEHAMVITKRGIDELEGNARKHAQAGLTGLLPEVRKNTVDRCEKEQWSEELRRCYLRARDYADSEACGAPPSKAGSAPAQ